MGHARTWLVAVHLLLGAGAGASPLNPGLGNLPPDVDRSSPLATLQGFLNAAHDGAYATASFYLNLDDVPATQQPAKGKYLARRLRFVLDRQSFLDLATVSHDPEGDPSHPGYFDVGVIPLEGPKGETGVPVRLSRLREGDHFAWVVSRDTVHAVDRLYEVYGPPLGESLPEVFFSRPLKGLELWQWMGLALVLLGALGVSYLFERLLLALAGGGARLMRFELDQALFISARGPVRLLFGSALLAAGTVQLLLPPKVQGGFDIVCRTLVIVGGAWVALRSISFGANLLSAMVTGRQESLANERSVRTQMAVLQRVATFVVYVVSAALILMQFTVVRSVGVSLLASAGVAGLVVGLAAQKSIGTLLAGIQLSITQPIRIGDSVVVEGESGTIENISLTYVVVRIWDLRRLVVPITYFLDKPFQNWSKGPSELLGTVMLQVDFTADVDALRTELGRILREEGKALWDGKTGSLVVSEATERTQSLRALVSAADPNASWDLRCLVRERLVGFLKRNPSWLPNARSMSVAAEATTAAQAPSTPPPPRG